MTANLGEMEPMNRFRSFGFGFRKDERGIAAVEFALLLPLMLMIYLGLVELSRGLRASQKVQYVASTLADLTGQILPTDKIPSDKCKTTTQTCINESDVNNIFSAALTLMTGINDPNVATKLKMAITEVAITGEPVAAPTTWKATTQWSVARNGAQVRPCQELTPAANPPAGSLDKISANWVGGTATAGNIIVVDVSYDYTPGVHFEFFKWNSQKTYTLKSTTYGVVRNTFVPNHIRYFMTSGTNCNAVP